MNDTPPVTPIVDAGLGNTSWIVDLGDGRLAVVDPGRHPGRYLAEAERRGARVAFSIETHLHADFVTGSRELADFGATVVASAGAELAWPHRPVADGGTVDLAGLRLRALATPGHTPEHLAYLLTDGDRPVGVFTGGSLLVGAVARTDLIAPDQTDGLARALWRSLHDQLLTLPDETPVYPTHGAGSFCAAPATDRRLTTIGDERRTNPLLAAPDEDAFVATLEASLGTYPGYFRHLRAVNQAGPAILGVPQAPLPALDLATFRRRLDEGALLVDTRRVEQWAAGHVPGALLVSLRDAFASWLGWLAEPDQPLLFVVAADQDRARLVARTGPRVTMSASDLPLCRACGRVRQPRRPVGVGVRKPMTTPGGIGAAVAAAGAAICLRTRSGAQGCTLSTGDSFSDGAVDQLVGALTLVVEDPGVDAHQDVDRVAEPAGHLGRRHARTQHHGCGGVA